MSKPGRVEFCLTAEYLESIFDLPGDIYSIVFNPSTRIVKIYCFTDDIGVGEGMEAPRRRLDDSVLEKLDFIRRAVDDQD